MLDRGHKNFLVFEAPFFCQAHPYHRFKMANKGCCRRVKRLFSSFNGKYRRSGIEFLERALCVFGEKTPILKGLF